MTILGRLALMLAAYLASVVAVVPLVILMMALVIGDPIFDPVLLDYAFVALMLLTVLTFVPSVLVIAYAEWRRVRDWRYFMLAGGLMALAFSASFGFAPGFGPDSAGLYVSAFLIAAGIAAGVIYWAIAGRNAGALRDAWRNRGAV